MRWVLVSNANTTLQEYDLVDNDERKVILKYNPRHQSVRVTSGGQQRLFYLESAGALSGKTIFNNEYGMEIGSLASGKFNNNEGLVLIDEKKYHYHLPIASNIELAIYDTKLGQPLVSCQIGNLTSNTNINIMLLGLCWYLSLAVSKERAVVHAA